MPFGLQTTERAWREGGGFLITATSDVLNPGPTLTGILLLIWAPLSWMRKCSKLQIPSPIRNKRRTEILLVQAGGLPYRTAARANESAGRPEEAPANRSDRALVAAGPVGRSAGEPDD